MIHDDRLHDLEEQGWEQRFVATDPRLSEAVAFYRELGYEVHLEPLPESSDQPRCEGECTACFEKDRDRYRVIFTRKTDKDNMEDLF